MSKNRRKTAMQEPEDVRIQGFLDMIAPSVIKFNTDHFICGNTYRCVWALREYPKCRRIACSSVAVGYSLSAHTQR